MASEEQSRSDLLRKQAVSFCGAFVEGRSPGELLGTFFIPSSTDNPQKPRIIEHGPDWARSRLPFLGRTFVGRDGDGDAPEGKEGTCDDYFRLLTSVLDFRPDGDVPVFPGPEAFAVDPEARSPPQDSQAAAAAAAVAEAGEGGVVTVTGQARFASKKTGKEWREKFMHRFSSFDDQGRIGHWEIWADPLSAWVAVGDDDFSKWSTAAWS